MKLIKVFLFLFLISLFSTAQIFAQANGSIGGQVVDSLGNVIVGSTVTVVLPDGKQKQVVTNSRGEYSVTGLAPGTYSVKAIAPKFALFQNDTVVVTAGQRNELIISMTVEGVKENVDVMNEGGVSTDPENSAGATVIKGKDLEALPDDPDELQAALQALAGPSAGPNGGQIYIDGFTGGQMPSKDQIREIRINQNPFSAEYDRLGFGRIEILTKPGSDKWRGQVFGNFNDARLNSRNPFASNRAPSQTKFFGGNISGPLKKGKSSFTLELNDRLDDTNTVINAVILDAAFNLTTLSQDIRVPTRRLTIGPRLDYQINDKNTLVARYSFNRTSGANQGIGDVSLLSRAFNSSGYNNEVRVTETMIINPKTVDETRFEFSESKRQQIGDNSIPTINVSSSFTGGGSSIGQNFTKNRTFEINNFVSTSFGKNNQHAVKFGGRLRHVNINDQSESNYGGTFSFPGFFGADPADLNGDGVVSSIEQYRAKVMGLVGARYNPTQFTIMTGNPIATVSQTDGGVYAMDDWRISPALLLSFGIRYEFQTNIHSTLNFAPRFGFAWSPGAGGAKAPKTVFRGGAGIFYDRFSQNYTLQALRFNGVNQLSLLVNANDTDPVRRAAALALLAQPVFNLNGVTNVPTAAQILAVLPQSSTIWQVAGGLTAPYTMQGALGIERQLPLKTTLAVYYIGSRTLHQLRIRNINAPICPLQSNCDLAPRPQSTLGNIYEYESGGTINQNQVVFNFRSTINTKISFFGNYRLGFTNGDTDGAGTFPAYSYDLTGEYGRGSGDIRNFFVVGGNITLPWGVSLAPFITAFTGRPFNITQGVDVNGDGQFAERPTFGQLNARCAALNLTASFCNIGSNDPNAIIPRNYGQGPNYFSVNLRLSKTFGFGKTIGEKTAGGGRNGGGGGGGIPGGMIGGPGGGGRDGGGGGGRGPGGGFGGFGGGSNDTRKPYNLNVGINFNNLFNNVNFGQPIGSLSSNRFGQSISTAGGGFGGFGGGGGGGGGTANRRVELQLRFSW